MEIASSTGAWLDLPTGQRLPVGRTCTIGRAQANDVILTDPRVSRQHALLQLQGDGRYRLVDFGSANGTQVRLASAPELRRVILPILLEDGAVIEIADQCLTFHQPEPAAAEGLERTSQLTVREVRRFVSWLLVADLVDSTRLAIHTAAEDLPQVVGRWFAECRELLESEGAVITQYLGDGFLAHWPDSPVVADHAREVIRRLAFLQSRGLKFRWVLHVGTVSAVTSWRPGEEHLLGPEVHFVYRMEGLAKELAQPLLISGTARDRLSGHMELREVGRHEVKGFDGLHPFYVPAGLGADEDNRSTR